MYSGFQLAKKYLEYYYHASNGKGHGMHSPFVFDFIRHVLLNHGNYAPPVAIESTRKTLLKDGALLEVEDLGAGSRRRSKQRTVSSVAKHALKSKKYAQLLYRLARHYQPQTIVELGTSLGITTAYLSAASTAAKLVTIEGSAAIAQKAQQNFAQLELKNITSLVGNFDMVLPGLLGDFQSVDLAYIDGNHRYEPTMRYFEQFLRKAQSHTILVFDDIHWSAEMEKAWEEIKAHPSVQYSIDIFFLGFVFFRKEFKVKQHFAIRF